MFVRFVIIVFFIFTSSFIHGQSSTTRFWTDLYLKSDTFKTWTLDGMVGIRNIVYDENWSRAHVWAIGKFHVSKHVNFPHGVMAVYNFNSTQKDVIEIRPFVGVYAKWPRFDLVSFDHLLRMESRNFLVDGTHKTANRFRYKISMKTKGFPNNSTHPIQLYIAWEEFSTQKTEIQNLSVDRSRYHVGSSLKLNPKMDLVFEYIFQQARANGGESFHLDANIFHAAFKLKI